jgi:hypothetical protein
MADVLHFALGIASGHLARDRHDVVDAAEGAGLPPRAASGVQTAAAFVVDFARRAS